jgi:hypothetical protein
LATATGHDRLKMKSILGMRGASSMSESLGSDDRFHDAIGRVLHYEWDPIGASDMPDAEGEYDLYIDRIQDMLTQREPRDRIVDHLIWIVTDRMGLGGDRRHAESVADRLIAL